MGQNTTPYDSNTVESTGTPQASTDALQYTINTAAQTQAASPLGGAQASLEAAPAISAAAEGTQLVQANLDNGYEAAKQIEEYGNKYANAYRKTYESTDKWEYDQTVAKAEAQREAQRAADNAAAAAEQQRRDLAVADLKARTAINVVDTTLKNMDRYVVKQAANPTVDAEEFNQVVNNFYQTSWNAIQQMDPVDQVKYSSAVLQPILKMDETLEEKFMAGTLTSADVQQSIDAIFAGGADSAFTAGVENLRMEVSSEDAQEQLREDPIGYVQELEASFYMAGEDALAKQAELGAYPVVDSAMTTDTTRTVDPLSPDYVNPESILGADTGFWSVLAPEEKIAVSDYMFNNQDTYEFLKTIKQADYSDMTSNPLVQKINAWKQPMNFSGDVPKYLAEKYNYGYSDTYGVSEFTGNKIKGFRDPDEMLIGRAMGVPGGGLTVGNYYTNQLLAGNAYSSINQSANVENMQSMMTDVIMNPMATEEQKSVAFDFLQRAGMSAEEVAASSAPQSGLMGGFANLTSDQYGVVGNVWYAMCGWTDAMANGARNMVLQFQENMEAGEWESVMGAGAAGFVGTEQATSQMIWEEAGVTLEDAPLGGFAVLMTTEVLLDPVTWIPSLAKYTPHGQMGKAWMTHRKTKQAVTGATGRFTGKTKQTPKTYTGETVDKKDYKSWKKNNKEAYKTELKRQKDEYWKRGGQDKKEHKVAKEAARATATVFIPGVTYFGSKHRSKSRAGGGDAGRDNVEGIKSKTTATGETGYKTSPGLMDRTKRFGKSAVMTSGATMAMDAMLTAARELGQKGAITANANVDDLTNAYARTINQMSTWQTTGFLAPTDMKNFEEYSTAMDQVTQVPVTTINRESYKMMSDAASATIKQLESDLSNILEYSYKIPVGVNPIRTLESFTNLYGTDLNTIAKNVVNAEIAKVNAVGQGDYINLLAQSNAPKKHVYESMLKHAENLQQYYTGLANNEAEMAKRATKNKEIWEASEAQLSKAGVPLIGKIPTTLSKELNELTRNNWAHVSDDVDGKPVYKNKTATFFKRWHDELYEKLDMALEADRTEMLRESADGDMSPEHDRYTNWIGFLEGFDQYTKGVTNNIKNTMLYRGKGKLETPTDIREDVKGTKFDEEGKALPSEEDKMYLEFEEKLNNLLTILDKDYKNLSTEELWKQFTGIEGTVEGSGTRDLEAFWAEGGPVTESNIRNEIIITESLRTLGRGEKPTGVNSTRADKLKEHYLDKGNEMSKVVKILKDYPITNNNQVSNALLNTLEYHTIPDLKSSMVTTAETEAEGIIELLDKTIGTDAFVAQTKRSVENMANTRINAKFDTFIRERNDHSKAIINSMGTYAYDEAKEQATSTDSTFMLSPTSLSMENYLAEQHGLTTVGSPFYVKGHDFSTTGSDMYGFVKDVYNPKETKTRYGLIGTKGEDTKAQAEYESSYADFQNLKKRIDEEGVINAFGSVDGLTKTVLGMGLPETWIMSDDFKKLVPKWVNPEGLGETSRYPQVQQMFNTVFLKSLHEGELKGVTPEEHWDMIMDLSNEFGGAIERGSVMKNYEALEEAHNIRYADSGITFEQLVTDEFNAQADLVLTFIKDVSSAGEALTKYGEDGGEKLRQDLKKLRNDKKTLQELPAKERPKDYDKQIADLTQQISELHNADLTLKKIGTGAYFPDKEQTIRRDLEESYRRLVGDDEVVYAESQAWKYGVNPDEGGVDEDDVEFDTVDEEGVEGVTTSGGVSLASRADRTRRIIENGVLNTLGITDAADAQEFLDVFNKDSKDSRIWINQMYAPTGEEWQQINAARKQISEVMKESRLTYGGVKSSASSSGLVDEDTAGKMNTALSTKYQNIILPKVFAEADKFKDMYGNALPQAAQDRFGDILAAGFVYKKEDTWMLSHIAKSMSDTLTLTEDILRTNAEIFPEAIKRIKAEDAEMQNLLKEVGASTVSQYSNTIGWYAVKKLSRLGGFIQEGPINVFKEERLKYIDKSITPKIEGLSTDSVSLLPKFGDTYTNYLAHGVGEFDTVSTMMRELTDGIPTPGLSSPVDNTPLGDDVIDALANGELDKQMNILDALYERTNVSVQQFMKEINKFSNVLSSEVIARYTSGDYSTQALIDLVDHQANGRDMFIRESLNNLHNNFQAFNNPKTDVKGGKKKFKLGGDSQQKWSRTTSESVPRGTVTSNVDAAGNTIDDYRNMLNDTKARSKTLQDEITKVNERLFRMNDLQSKGQTIDQTAKDVADKQYEELYQQYTNSERQISELNNKIMNFEPSETPITPDVSDEVKQDIAAKGADIEDPKAFEEYNRIALGLANLMNVGSIRNSPLFYGIVEGLAHNFRAFGSDAVRESAHLLQQLRGIEGQSIIADKGAAAKLQQSVDKAFEERGIQGSTAILQNMSMNIEDAELNELFKRIIPAYMERNHKKYGPMIAKDFADTEGGIEGLVRNLPDAQRDAVYEVERLFNRQYDNMDSLAKAMLFDNGLKDVNSNFADSYENGYYTHVLNKSELSEFLYGREEWGTALAKYEQGSDSDLIASISGMLNERKNDLPASELRNGSYAAQQLRADIVKKVKNDLTPEQLELFEAELENLQLYSYNPLKVLEEFSNVVLAEITQKSVLHQMFSTGLIRFQKGGGEISKGNLEGLGTKTRQRGRFVDEGGEEFLKVNGDIFNKMLNVPNPNFFQTVFKNFDAVSLDKWLSSGGLTADVEIRKMVDTAVKSGKTDDLLKYMDENMYILREAVTIMDNIPSLFQKMSSQDSKAAVRFLNMMNNFGRKTALLSGVNTFKSYIGNYLNMVASGIPVTKMAKYTTLAQNTRRKWGKGMKAVERGEFTGNVWNASNSTISDEFAEFIGFDTDEQMLMSTMFDRGMMDTGGVFSELFSQEGQLDMISRVPGLNRWMELNRRSAFFIDEASKMGMMDYFMKEKGFDPLRAADEVSRMLFDFNPLQNKYQRMASKIVFSSTIMYQIPFTVFNMMLYNPGTWMHYQHALEQAQENTFGAETAQAIPDYMETKMPMQTSIMENPVMLKYHDIFDILGYMDESHPIKGWMGDKVLSLSPAVTSAITLLTGDNPFTDYDEQYSIGQGQRAMAATKTMLGAPMRAAEALISGDPMSLFRTEVDPELASKWVNTASNAMYDEAMTEIEELGGGNPVPQSGKEYLNQRNELSRWEEILAEREANQSNISRGGDTSDFDL